MRQRPTRNQLRIIGGKWRGRKIHFPDVPGLRPTADRIRETLFNWLAGWVEGATCVDLFAGSGALGLEAASRGAKRVILVDREPQAVAALEQAKRQLDADNIEVLGMAADRAMAQLPPAEILFLDPPFDYPALDALLQSIADSGVLKAGAWIYVESAVDRAIVTPPDWRLHRQKQAGQVAFRLLQTSASETGDTVAPD